METAVWNLKQNFEQYADKVDTVFDCMIAEFLLSQGKYFFTQETTLKRYDVSNLQELYEKQKLALEALPKLNELFRTIEMPVVKVLWQMEQNGIGVDREELEKLGVMLNEELGKVTEDIYAESQTPFNLGSPMQVGKILVDTFHVPLQKTATGKYATGEPELSKHAEAFPIVQKILKHRALAKLKSTYVEGLIKKIGDNGKIHTTFNQTVAITGRLSSTNPNLQNIPANSEIGRQIKSCFIPDKGNTLIAFDYSQQELRILAHITKEPKLIEAFSQDKDIHTVTASTIFKVPYEEVTKQQRYTSKTINFGVLYGMGSFGLSQSLNITTEEASAFITEFFNNFSEVKKFYDVYLKDAAKNKYAETMFGRRRFVEYLNNATRRELYNFPIQSAAADVVKKAMVDVHTNILEKRPEVKLLLQIHDELVFEIPQLSEPEFKTFVEEVSSIMENTYAFDVPMKVEAKTGNDWGDMQKVELAGQD